MGIYKKEAVVMHMRFEQWLHAPATAFGKSIADRQRHLRCFLPAYHCPARQIFRAEYQTGKYFWRYLSGIPISAPCKLQTVPRTERFLFSIDSSANQSSSQNRIRSICLRRQNFVLFPREIKSRSAGQTSSFLW